MDRRGGNRLGARSRPRAILIIQTPGDANADVVLAVAACLGERVRQHRRRSRTLRASAGVLAPMPYDPPPPPNITGCVSYNGRWVTPASAIEQFALSLDESLASRGN